MNKYCKTFVCIILILFFIGLTSCNMSKTNKSNDKISLLSEVTEKSVIDEQSSEEGNNDNIELESQTTILETTEETTEESTIDEASWWNAWCEWIDSLDIDELTTRVSYGEFGEGDELKGNLRERYDEVQEYLVLLDGSYRHYFDSTCSIWIYKKWYADSWCYCAHIILSDYWRFGSGSAYGYYGNGYETTYDAGERLGAILCVNGDFADQAAEPHAAIRQGVVEAYGWKNTYVPEAYNAYTGMLFNAYEGYTFPNGNKCSSYTIEESAALGLITDTFIFGPPSLNDGYIKGSNSGNKRPRTLIGTTGIPGDLWLVVTAGDYTDGVSPGLTSYEGATLLRDLGCTFGGHLDGGGSSAMYFMGEMLVSNSGWAGRPVGDFAFVR